ncbi:butyrate kinase [Enterococcus sp. LJL128]
MLEVVLVINPGSTSTKAALFADGQVLAEQKIDHSSTELSEFPGVILQKDFRRQAIQTFISTKVEQPFIMKAVVGRGGLLKPIPGGTYVVNQDMLNDLETEKYNTHASNLGAILAADFAKQYGVAAYIVDPVVTDELQPVARISGLNGIERRSVGHILNQKAVARTVLAKHGKKYEESQVVVAHLGGGVSIGAHKLGRIIDLSNGLDGEGPYTPERTGSLPLVSFAEKVVQEKLTLPEIKRMLAGIGGLKSYLNEIDIRAIEQRIAAGEENVKIYLDGMCYQINKEIAAMAAVLNGQVDLIILTGGISYSTYIVEAIKQGIGWIAPVEVLAGEMEMDALYQGVVRVLSGTEQAKEYKSV